MGTMLDELKVIFGIEARGFGNVRSQVKGVVDGIKSDFSGLKSAAAGYFTVAASREIVASVQHMSERWKDLAEQTGLSTDEVQRYDAAFKKVGLSAEDAAKAFDLLTNKRREALEEGGASEMLMRKFGISQEELQNLKTGAQLFERIARGRSADNQADRELFVEAFGKRGGKMLAGATALNELGDINMASKTDIQRIDDAAKAMEAAARDFKIASIPLVAQLLEVVNYLARIYGDGPETDEETARGRADRANEIRSEAGNISRRGREGATEAKALEAVATDLIRRGNITESEISALATELYSIRSGRIVTPPDVSSRGAKGKASESAISRELAPEYTGTRQSIEIDRSIKGALFNTMFKAGSSDDKKKMLDSRIASLMNDASGADPSDAAKMRAEVIKLVGERAEIDRMPLARYDSDAMAKVGGYIGGASASADPSLFYQQNMLSVQESILMRLENAPAAFRNAIMQAFSTKAIDQITGGVR